MLREPSHIVSAPIKVGCGRSLSAMLLAGLLLAGCGEIGIKRGAGSDAFAADQRACHQRSADDAAYKSCLSAAGWTVAGLDADPVPPPAPVAPSSPVPPAPAAATGLAPLPAAPSAPSAAAVDPTGIETVDSWWKIGAGSQDLSAAVAACVTVLGSAQQPDSGVHHVTHALHACLTQHGWHGTVHAG